MSQTANGRSSLSPWWSLSPQLAFLFVSLSLGQLGDGLNIFQGVYLVGLGWNEGAVGASLSLMGFTTLLIQPFAGDWVDKASVDRRIFLVAASLVTALSASTVLLMQPGNRTSDHYLMYTSKIVEGIASSFIQPCLAALTLASFGPNSFDSIMASNVLWGHVGSFVAALLAGLVAYVSYPQVQLCFLVIGASALIAIIFVPSLPQGDPRLGRGLAVEQEQPISIPGTEFESLLVKQSSSTDDETQSKTDASSVDQMDDDPSKAASYRDVFLDKRICILCFTGFFFHFANANVLLVLGELMGQGTEEDSRTPNRMAMPYSAGAIVMAQATMTAVTWIGDRLTTQGVGRKPLFYVGILSLPIRCALILTLAEVGPTYLMLTQIMDGVGAGMLGLIQPYLIADITFGTGRFNVVNGVIASFWGCGATLSNFLGQLVVQHYGHVASLTASLLLSLIPIALFALMPETHGLRGQVRSSNVQSPSGKYHTFDL